MVNDALHSSLSNISEEVIRNDIPTENAAVLAPVRVNPLNVNSVVISSNVTVDPTLQREVNYMNAWMAKATKSEVPFVPVISKKKKGSKSLKGSSAYQTRSLGSFPKSQ